MRYVSSFVDEKQTEIFWLIEFSLHICGIRELSSDVKLLHSDEKINKNQKKKTEKKNVEKSTNIKYALHKKTAATTAKQF